MHQYLVLIDLEHHGVQDEAGGLGHVEGLLGLRQPVDGVLQGALEARGQRQSLLQLPLGPTEAESTAYRTHRLGDKGLKWD